MEKIFAKHIIMNASLKSNWFGSDYNMNIYRGCSHGCIYCDSRSDCYKDPNFNVVKIKDNALPIIRDDLDSKVKKGVIATGAMSDPYNPFEKELQLTRHALELIDAYEFGVAIATKSDLVTRDIDILKSIKTHSPVIVKITITCADDNLCSTLEPNVASSSLRFAALKQLSDAGIFCGVLMMPILPFINDNEENVKEIVLKAYQAGAKFIYPSFGMTLRAGNREYYYDKLEQLFPGTKEKYIKTYQTRYSCTSRHAKKLYQIFTTECLKYGILYDMDQITLAYKKGYTSNAIINYKNILHK